MNHRPAALALLLLLAGCGAPPTADLVLDDVWVVDASGRRPDRMSVVVRGDLISELVTPAEAAGINADVRIDGAGSCTKLASP